VVAIKEKLEIGGENKYETVPHFLTQSRHCIIYQQKRNWRHRTEEIIHLLTLYQRALWLEPDGLRTDLVGDWTNVRFCFPMTWPVIGDTGSC